MELFRVFGKQDNVKRSVTEPSSTFLVIPHKNKKRPSSHTWDERRYFRDTTQIDSSSEKPTSISSLRDVTCGSTRLNKNFLPQARKCYSLQGSLPHSHLLQLSLNELSLRYCFLHSLLFTMNYITQFFYCQ